MKTYLLRVCPEAGMQQVNVGGFMAAAGRGRGSGGDRVEQH